MRGQRRVRAAMLRLGVLCIAAVATVALAQVTAAGAFSGATANGANGVSSATSFCTATATTLYSAGDAWVDQVAPTNNHQNDLELRVRASPTQARRTWIRFDLPTIPRHCTVTQARLRFYNKVPTSGRSIVVYRGTPSATPWTAGGINWGNQPTFTGTAVTSTITTTSTTAGWQYWHVTDHVLTQYAGGATGNNGLVLVDSGESTGSGQEQVYYDRQDGTYNPTLVLTWG